MAQATPLPNDNKVDELAVEKQWHDVGNWYFDFETKVATPDEALVRAQACMTVVAEMAAVLDSVDVRRVIEGGYDHALNRYASVMQMMAANAYALLDTIDPDELRKGAPQG